MSQATPSRPRTLQDVATLAGVSLATVSRVLNGHPDVSDSTRDAVLRVVREHGFSKNRAARALTGGRTSLIGVTVPEVDSSYFAEILSGASEALHEQDMRVVLCPTLHEHEREVVLLDRLMHGTTDGALLLNPSESEDELRTLLNHGYPFVVVEPRTTLGDGIPCVTATHSAGATAATEHLLELGHRRIGAILGPPEGLATTERLKGFHAALRAAGIAPDPSFEVPSNFKYDGGEHAAGALLDRPDRPTAIFAFNDEVAVGAMVAARARGLRVPEDVSVVGFDDTLQARLSVPPLTTVRQPLAELARIAVSLLNRLVEGQRVDATRIELHTKLVVRDSTSRPS